MALCAFFLIIAPAGVLLRSDVHVVVDGAGVAVAAVEVRGASLLDFGPSTPRCPPSLGMANRPVPGTHYPLPRWFPSFVFSPRASYVHLWREGLSLSAAASPPLSPKWKRD